MRGGRTVARTWAGATPRGRLGLIPTFLLCIYPAAAQVAPPAAHAAPQEITIHGETLVDPYRWLEDLSARAVINHLEAENRYADQVMKDTTPLQRKLHAEMLRRTEESDLRPPAGVSGAYFYLRRPPGAQYWMLCRKLGSLSAPEQPILDLNELAGGENHPALGVWRLSPDGRLLAFSVQMKGDEVFTIHVKDLAARRFLPDRIPNAGRWLEWGADGKTLYYVTPITASPAKVLRHTLSQGAARDAAVYTEKDDRSHLALMKTSSGEYVIVLTYGGDGWEVRYWKADQLAQEPKLLRPRQPGVHYWLTQQGPWFYVRVNEPGGEFRIMKAPVDDPLGAPWQEVFPPGGGTTVSDVTAFLHYLVVLERENGLGRIVIRDLRSGTARPAQFSEPAYSVRLPSQLDPEFQLNLDYSSTVLQFLYSSFAVPRSVYEYDMEHGSRRLIWQERVRGLDPGRYRTERIQATASDGIRIPISLVYRKPLVRNGERPMLLYGFGHSGFSTEPWFDSDRLSLLDRGVIFAVAHIRGGGELGKRWHDGATGLLKINSFTDFIACAEHLQALKYTSANRLAISGTSAGGMLVTAVANMRPDLFRAVVAAAPWVELLVPVSGGTQWKRSLDLPDPNTGAGYRAILACSPYDNVKAQAYPAMLLTGALNDPRVACSQPAKLAAKLRAAKTDDRPVLLKVDMRGAGHLGASGRYDRLAATAFEYAFLLQAFGINQ